MNKKKYVKYLNILLGSLFITFFLHNRIFRVRLPKDLWIFYYNNAGIFEIKFNILLLSTIGLLLSGFIIYHNLSLLLGRKHKHNIFTTLSEYVTNYIDHILWEVYNFIASYVPDGYHKISTFSYYFYETFSKQPELLFTFILYGIRLIILSCFVIDVYIFFKLHYMYKALYLLCISLLIKLIFYILKDFAKNLEEAESYLIITPKGINETTGEPVTGYALKPEHRDADLIYHIGQFILCNKVSGYLDFYDRYRAFFSPYFHVILHTIYFISWLYICIKNGIFFFTLE